MTDKLRSYGAALRDLEIEHVHDTTNRLNNRAGTEGDVKRLTSHVPIRRRERRCKDLSHINLPKYFFQFTNQYTTFTTLKGISFQDKH